MRANSLMTTLSRIEFHLNECETRIINNLRVDCVFFDLAGELLKQKSILKHYFKFLHLQHLPILRD